MLNIVNINLLKLDGISIKPSVVAVGSIGRGSRQPSGAVLPAELSVPWQELQTHPELFSLLNWRLALSEFKGRGREWEMLTDWALNGPDVSIKFIIGEGGVGKTRLAAEFASELRKHGWAAGIVGFRRPFTFQLNRKGTLLVIDYPEEDKGAVEELLHDLSVVGERVRLRVLFLTRRRIEDWLELFRDAHVAGLADMIPVTLSPLRGSEAHGIFCSFQEQAAIEEAVKIRRRLADASPARYEPDLARSLGTLGSVFRNLGRRADAASAYQEGAKLMRPYAGKWPASPYAKLLSALEKDFETVC